jgi:hypothetical protein
LDNDCPDEKKEVEVCLKQKSLRGKKEEISRSFENKKTPIPLQYSTSMGVGTSFFLFTCNDKFV